MKVIKVLLSIIGMICLLGYSGCNKSPLIDEPQPEPNDTIAAPVDYTIRGQILSLPDNYSLLKEILKQSGLAEALADTTQSYTFFIQNNTDFAAADIYSISDLLTQLRTAAPEVKDDSVLLARFIAYRTISGTIETDSLFKMPLLETLVAGEKIFLSLSKNDSQSVLKFNDLNGHLTAPDAVLDNESEYSNHVCSNGVIHKINGNLWVKNRKPYRIYWDIAEQPEIMALPNFRQPGYGADYNVGELSEIKWQVNSGMPLVYSQIFYYCETMPQDISAFNEKSQYVYGDILSFTLDLSSTQWIEFKTPVLIGSPDGVAYKVWLCYRRELSCEMKVTFKQDGQDDQVMPDIFDTSAYMPDPYAEGSSPELIEAQGWKMYNAKKYSSVICSHFLGTIKVYTTGRHTLRLEPTSVHWPGNSGSFDMIQFIPADENQLWPRVDMLGNWIDKDVEECNIFPYEECGQQ